MDKKKKLNETSDLSIFHMLNSCSYDTKWMEDTFTMQVCRECHKQLYSVYDFIEMCLKNSSLLQGYVELLKHGSNDIAQPIDRLQEREMVKMEVVIDVNMISANDAITDPIKELSVKNELDVDMSFMNAAIDIKHEPLICKNIKIEHIRDQNEILVTNVLDEDHNIKTQFSSHSETIYVNNTENNNVPNSSFNKVYLQNQIEPIERMCNEIQQRVNDQNYKIKLPVFSNVNECLVQNGAVETCFNPGVCSTQRNKVELLGCELKRISDKITSAITENPVERTECNRKVKQAKNSSVPYSIDNMFYIMMPIAPTLPVLNIPSINNTVVKNTDNSINNIIPLTATDNCVRNWKRKLEPPRKCDICHKTYDTHDGLRLHL
ncbi:hypothetical protein CBL_12349, partial [Carabus blaptoides fortunei]